MTKALRVADRVWSTLSSSVTVALILLFLFWVVFQKPSLDVQASGMVTTYNSTAGSTIYIENPLRYTEGADAISLHPRLVSENGERVVDLPAIEDVDAAITHHPDSRGKQGRPVYAITLPANIEKGVYTYKVEARYAMNILRDGSMDLPTVKIVVE